MDDNAKPGMRKFYFGKCAQRRETLSRLKNAHRRESRKLYRDAGPALLFGSLFHIYNFT